MGRWLGWCNACHTSMRTRVQSLTGCDVPLIPASKRQRQLDPFALQAIQPSFIWWVPGLRELGERLLRDNSWGFFLISTIIHTHACTHTHSLSLINTHPNKNYSTWKSLVFHNMLGSSFQTCKQEDSETPSSKCRAVRSTQWVANRAANPTPIIWPLVWKSMACLIENHNS